MQRSGFNIDDWSWRRGEDEEDYQSETEESAALEAADVAAPQTAAQHPTDQASTMSPTEVWDSPLTSPTGSIVNEYAGARARQPHSFNRQHTTDSSEAQYEITVQQVANDPNQHQQNNSSQSQQPWLSSQRDNIQFLAGAAIFSGLVCLGGIPAFLAGLAGYAVIQGGRLYWYRGADSHHKQQ